MASLLLRAFTFEAYLNHLGEMHLKLWNANKEIRWFQKFRRICTHLSFTPDTETRPYSTLRPLFRFRNQIAHGKSLTVIEEREIESADSDKYFWPLTEWEKFCTHENADDAKQDISSIVIELHKRAGFNDDPFASPEARSSVRLNEKQTGHRPR
jgi:hypothetical protein